jgi:predicted HTH domain antitoxin
MGAKERTQYKEKIIDLYVNQNIKMSNIATVLDINRLDVKKVLINEGLYQESVKFIKDDKTSQKLMVKMYSEDNLTLKEIAKRLDYGVKTVKKVLMENNISRRNAGFYNRKYSLDENVFSVYNPESVYWAGFIAGDGCVFSHGLSNSTINNSLNVGLSSVDESHLIKLQKFLKYDGVLYEGKNKIALNVNNRKICEDLKKYYNITNNKTEIYSPPNTIPSDLEKYFVLGLLDSDGHVTRSKRPKPVTKHYYGKYVYTIGFTGTNETCEYIKTFFNSNVKLFKRHNNDVNNYSVLFQGNLQVMKYLSMLYDDISIKFCLERKHKLYNELIEQYENSRL